MTRTVSQGVVSVFRDKQLITVCFYVSAVSQNYRKYIVHAFDISSLPNATGGEWSEGYFPIEGIPKGCGFEPGLNRILGLTILF